MRDEIIEELRSFGIGRHIIFYWLCKTEIDVVRILHKRMNVTRHFGDVC
jgi:plasmid stabilization system protein ParE